MKGIGVVHCCIRTNRDVIMGWIIRRTFGGFPQIVDGNPEGNLINLSSV